MSAGPHGFQIATFPDGTQCDTDQPNLLLEFASGVAASTGTGAKAKAKAKVAAKAKGKGKAGAHRHEDTRDGATEHDVQVPALRLDKNPWKLTACLGVGSQANVLAQRGAVGKRLLVAVSPNMTDQFAHVANAVLEFACACVRKFPPAECVEHG